MCVDAASRRRYTAFTALQYSIQYARCSIPVCHSSPVATARLKNYHKLINLVVATSAETVAWWTSVVEEDETGQLEMLGSARARAE